MSEPTLFPGLSLRLQRVVEAIADGETLDWTAIEASATDEEDRRVAARLRAISRIASLQLGDGEQTATTLGAADVPARDTPARWGSLHVLEQVGAGRFGDVYRAWDPALDRDVALKLLRDDSVSPDGDATLVHEGRMMARVRHPNVVTIHGAQRIDGRTGLWMEFVGGVTLATELRQRGPFKAGDLATVGIELAKALRAVHEAGLVHRDVKAQNVMRDAGGRIVLGDFGTGHELDRLPANSFAGTPAFLAPEIFQHQCATPRSDIYSLGALLFHLATARYPVDGHNVEELRTAHGKGQQKSLSALRPDLPRRLVAIIERALAADPADRFPSAAAMETAIAGAVLVRRDLRSPLWWVGVVALMLAAAAAWTRGLTLPPVGPRVPDTSVNRASGGPGGAEQGMATPPLKGQGSSLPTTLPESGPAAITLAPSLLEGSPVAAVGVPPRRDSTLALLRVDTGFESPVRIFAASANSRIVTCSVVGRQAISLCDLETRTIVELRVPAQGADEAGYMPVRSPDGRFTAYVWRAGSDWSVRIIDVSGRDRELLAAESGVNLLKLRWIRGGAMLAVLRTTAKGSEPSGRYDEVSPDGKTVRPLWSFNPLAGAATSDISADGRSIVMEVAGEAGDRDLAVIDISTGQQRTILHTPSNDVKPIWTPDGSGVVYLSDGQGVRGLYTLPLRDGKAAGSPTLVRDISGGTMRPMGFADDGTLFAERLPYWYKTFRSKVDLAQGVAEAPRWLDARAAADQTPGVASSPDGQRIAYIAGNLDDPTTAPARIVVLHANGDWDKEFRLTGKLGRKSRVRWSRDGRRLAVSTGSEGKGIIEVFHVGDVAPAQVLAADGAWDLKWDPLSDGIYYGSGREIRRYDLETGMSSVFYRSELPLAEVATFDVSPIDGALLLPVAGNAVMIVRPGGKASMRHIAQGSVVALAWTPDGSRIAVSSIQDPRRATVVVMDADGGPVVPLAIEAEPIVDLSFGPGGRELFFAAGNQRPEYWALSGVLPR